MMKRVTAIANSGSVAGVNFEAQGVTTNKGKLDAALIWTESFKEAYDNAGKIKDEYTGQFSMLPADDKNVIAARQAIVAQYGVSLKGLANGGIKVLGVKK